MSRSVCRPAVVLALTAALAAAASTAPAQSPEIASWLVNLTGRTGYNGLPADVQQVRFSAGSVYVNCSDIPGGYTIGPWPLNPNTPDDQGFLFKIPRAPVVATGNRTRTPLGPTAVWIHGVVAFNALDAMSYNNRNVWHQNAVVVEAPSFDSCSGHPAPSRAYHHHQNPRCLYRADPTLHGPILGYAFDGFPIYGPYAYLDPDGSGGIARMRSSYRTRAIADRTTLPDGTPLGTADYGPPVSATYPLGYYAEDFEFVPGLGDLDADNGRFAVTPEYPCGTYAYFATIDPGGASAYPYAVGPEYHGVVEMENITSRGHVTVSEPVTSYAGRLERALLRDDSIRSLAPPVPPLASVLPLVQGWPAAGDAHVERVHDGDLDPDRDLVADATRPLVLYALDIDETLRLVKGSGCSVGQVVVRF